MQLFTGPALDLNMSPALTHFTSEAHRHDSYRATRRGHTNEFAYAKNSGARDDPR
jgi:hypothetical protein